MEAIDAYKVISLKTEKSGKDIRILESLDEDMLHLFDIMKDEQSPNKR